jgi:RND family efflux transporter MFP subunit
MCALAGCGSGPGAGAADTGPAASPAASAAAPEAALPAPDPLPHEAGADPTLETSLAPLHDVEVVARVAGEVVTLAAEEGDRVARGGALARIDDRERRATLDEREAALAARASAWERAQRLHEESVISEEQWIAVRSEWQVARAQRVRARLEWQRCTVRAPFAGVIALRKVQHGAMVKEGDVLFRVSDPDHLRAELLLPESRLGTIRPGQSVTLVPVAGGPPTAARVTRVNPLVDAASGTFRVTIDVDNREARLPAGVTVRVVLGARGSAGK